MSDPSSTTATQLFAVQQELKAPKSEKGRFGSYRSAESILTAVKPLLAKHGLILNLTDQVSQIGNRNYVIATAGVLFPGDEWAKCTGNAWEGDISRGLDAPQITGAASSYARKYALSGLFAIDSGEKDPDSHQAPAQATQSPSNPVAAARPAVGADTAPQLASAAQKSLITQLLTKRGVSKEHMGDVLVSDYKVVDPHALTRLEAGDVIDKLKAVQS